jgi:hypothetical protein
MAVDGEWCGAQIGFGAIRTAGRGNPERSSISGKMERRESYGSGHAFAQTIASLAQPTSCF